MAWGNPRGNRMPARYAWGVSICPLRLAFRGSIRTSAIRTMIREFC